MTIIEFTHKYRNRYQIVLLHFLEQPMGKLYDDQLGPFTPKSILQTKVVGNVVTF